MSTTTCPGRLTTRSTTSYRKRPRLLLRMRGLAALSGGAVRDPFRAVVFEHNSAHMSFTRRFLLPVHVLITSHWAQAIWTAVGALAPRQQASDLVAGQKSAAGRDHPGGLPPRPAPQACRSTGAGTTGPYPRAVSSRAAGRFIRHPASFAAESRPALPAPPLCLYGAPRPAPEPLLVLLAWPSRLFFRGSSSPWRRFPRAALYVCFLCVATRAVMTLLPGPWSGPEGPLRSLFFRSSFVWSTASTAPVAQPRMGDIGHDSTGLPDIRM